MSEHCDGFFNKKVLYEWEIRDFLSKKGLLESPKFLLSGAYFSIEIYPYGYEDDDKFVSLQLCKYPSRTDCHLEYTMGFKRTKGSILLSLNTAHSFPTEGQKYGWKKFFERSKLTGNDTLTVFCEILEADIPAVEAETQTSWADSFQTLSKDFEKYYLNGCETDVVLDVRGKKFSAHRFVLASRSSVFRSMLQTDMKERETGDVKITDCDPESFQPFLLFLYSGKLDVVSSANAMGLYVAADKYNVEDLKVECCECLARELSLDSICDVLRLATLYEEPELLKSAKEYFMKNAGIILTTVKWGTFLSENLTVANELFIEVVGKLTDLLAKTKP